MVGIPGGLGNLYGAVNDMGGVGGVKSTMLSNFQADDLGGLSNISSQVGQLQALNQMPGMPDMSTMCSSVTDSMSQLSDHCVNQFNNIDTNLATVKQATHIDNLTGQESNLCDVVEQFFGSITGGAKSIINGIGSAIQPLITGIKNVIGTAIALTQEMISQLSGLISAAISTVSGLVSSAIKMVTSEISALAGAAAKVLNFNFANNLGALFGHPCTSSMLKLNPPTLPPPSDGTTAGDAVRLAALNNLAENPSPSAMQNAALVQGTTASLQPPPSQLPEPTPPVVVPGGNVSFRYSPPTVSNMNDVIALKGKIYGVNITYTTIQSIGNTSIASDPFTASLGWVISQDMIDALNGVYTSTMTAQTLTNKLSSLMMLYTNSLIKGNTIISDNCYMIQGIPNTDSSGSSSITMLVPKDPKSFVINSITSLNDSLTHDVNQVGDVSIKLNGTTNDGTLVDYNYVKNSLKAGQNFKGINF